MNLRAHLVSRFSSFIHGSCALLRAEMGRDEIVLAAALSGLLQQVDAVPGHVAELGVGSGTNSLVLSTLITDVFCWDNTQYVGFDTFHGYPSDVLNRNPAFREGAFQGDDFSLNFVQSRIDASGLTSTCVLVKGDLRETVPALLEDPPKNLLSSPDGLMFRLLYIDCNDMESAVAGLTTFAAILSPGALIAIDERRLGGETAALLNFAAAYSDTFQPLPNPGFPGRICLKKIA